MPNAKGFFILNNMKTCSKCKVEKEFSEFVVNKKNKDKLDYVCKKCNKEYRLNNKTKTKDYNNKYYFKNKEKIVQYRIDNKEKISIINKQYKTKNKESRNKYYNNRRKTDPLFKLTCNTRDLIRKSIKGNGYTKKSKTYQILGCSYEEFKQHLESQFTEGMTWDNQGKWHLDHIYPVSRATDEQHLIKLNHYTNFQPLWAEDNIKKFNKL